PALLEDLAVARARGGTVFTLENDQWNAILAFAGDEERAAFALRKQNASGQGFGLTLAERADVERYAQRMAEDHFLHQGYDVTDVSRTSPYDLHCFRDGDELRVEVKGTTGRGETVFLTRNEVEHCRRFPSCVALYVVRNIKLERSGRDVTAHGGDAVVFDPW